MNKTVLTSFTILCLLTMVFLMGLAFNIRIVKASGAIYIRADGSIDPSTAPISTVGNVTYTFTDNINDSIVVERNNILVDGNGYTLQGSGSGNGFEISNINNVTIKNTNIKNFNGGIRLDSSSSSTIAGNNITNNYHGMLLSDSSDNAIVGNNVTANNRYGIYLYGSSSSNGITENNITNNLHGINLWFYSNNNIIFGNTITNNMFGIVLSGLNNSITGNTFFYDGLVVSDSYGNVVVNNSVNGKPLVYLEGVSDFRVEDAGQVVLVRCSNITVKDLNISNTAVGIQLLETSSSTIAGNNITSNRHGIYLLSSSDNSIAGNNVANNSDGIALSCSSNNNSIFRNNIINNWCGIYLDVSFSNRISGNNVANNQQGLKYAYGFNNLIYHNNFIDNAQQAGHEPGSDPSIVNVWNDGYPSGGNYWSDYNGTDADGDGIGDTSYVINWSNQDPYPLMGSFDTFDAGTWNNVAYNVDVISNSTISRFHFNPSEGAFLSFNVTGEDRTVGFCRVTIPKSLLRAEDGQWSVVVGDKSVNYTIIPDENYTYLYFTYNHSTKIVQIIGTDVIPEFLLHFMLLAFLMLTTIPLILARKKRHRKSENMN